MGDNVGIVMSHRRWILAALLMSACADDPVPLGVPFLPDDSGTSTDGSTGDPPDEPDDTGSTTGDGNDAGSTTDDAATGSATETCPRVRIDVGTATSLNVRPDPSTAQDPVGSLANGSIVDVLGEVAGEDIEGNDLWYEIAAGDLEGFISATYASCTEDEPPALDPNAFYLPLTCGSMAEISQGNFGGLSHQGQSAYAFDFAIPLGTPLVAIAEGVVTHLYDQTGPGDPCYDGGGSACITEANFVTLEHADGTLSIYAHLQQVHVSIGDTVGVGQTVGLSGSTGYSTGPHAHVARMEGCGSSHCQSIEVRFADVEGNGIPETGDTVVSGNCP
jgi:murein DD-endopeptidase MepM/ murein hydrolase activator NlpD